MTIFISRKIAAAGPKLGTLVAGVALFSLVVCTGRAVAQEASGPSFAFNVGANTDYVFRAISEGRVVGGLKATF